MSKIDVCLDSCLSYDKVALQRLMQRQFDQLGVQPDLSGKRVLLKPNLISGGAPPLACSNPKFAAAVAAVYLSRGAKVMLGDSPAFGTGAQVMKRQGFKPHFADLAVEYVPFSNRVVETLSCGIRIGVAADALDCDYLVNLPRIKAHDQMGVTMAVKNIFGIVIGARKALLHMRVGGGRQLFSEMILDLHSLLPPSFVCADAIEVMNGEGPVKGTSLVVGCLASSWNAVAIDRAMLAVLEIDKKRIPLAVSAAEKGLGGSSLGDLTFPHSRPEDFKGSGFAVPGSLAPVRFSPLRYVKNSLKRVLLRLDP